MELRYAGQSLSKGEKGDRGEKGEKGETGARGEQGEKGEPGGVTMGQVDAAIQAAVLDSWEGSY